MTERLSLGDWNVAAHPQMANPIHRGGCSDDVAWSTINAGEAIPGVVTPLTWSFFGDTVDRAMKATFYDLGVLERRQVVASRVAEDRLWDVFYGRASANLNTFRWLGDRMPGTSGDAIEEQIFGQVRPGVKSENVLGRYPFVAARMPINAVRLVGRLKATCGPAEALWQQAVTPGAIASRAQAQDVLRRAVAQFEIVMRPHTLAAMLCQSFYEQLRVASERAGRPGLELDLVTGYGAMAETAVVTDLWAVSRDRLSLDEFVRRHGYHGPSEGELSARVWRINRAPLEDLLAAYREMGADRDPEVVERVRADERRRAEAELFGALSGAQRSSAKLMAKLAAKFIPLRGTGKAAFLQCVDAARAAARAIGEQMVADGQLSEPEDVFMFTLPELIAPVPADDPAALAAERRATHDEYRTLDIPDLFNGVPIPFAIGAEDHAAHAGDTVTGTPVSAGVVEGVARLVIDPEADEGLQPGEILVCRTTDPSWASAMMLAAALVIDIGGPISHGAIIARELGIPCVIGTRTGTAQIRSGDRLRVDGSKGEVVVLSAPPAAEPEPTPEPESEPEPTPEQHPTDTERRSEETMATNELLVMRALRMKGRASTEVLVGATGVSESDVASIVAALVSSGEAREMKDFYMLLPPGRQRMEVMLDEERAGVDSEAMKAVYESFDPVNSEFKVMASDWQQRDGEPNDHSDAAYDQSVLDRLPGIHERVSPVVAGAAALAPRLEYYKVRFQTALDKVAAGDQSYLLHPLKDSYHTVWFEFHEELIGLAGLSREAEAASGRAE
jgi:pyruvate,water dikinase